MVNNNRKVLLKQPPPKKAQRQFERMWNVSKPGAAGKEFYSSFVFVVTYLCL